MTHPERNAWLEIIAVGLASAAYAALFALYSADFAFAAFCFMALPSLAMLVRRAIAKTPLPVLDERDQAILANSSLVGYAVFWLAFVGGTMGLWAFYGGRGSIPVASLPAFPMAGCMVLMLSRSVATLVQYARGQ